MKVIFVKYNKQNKTKCLVGNISIFVSKIAKI